MTAWCVICDEEEILRHTEMEICNNCYENLRYWKKKSIKETMVRRQNLAKYSRRMDFMIGTQGGNE